MLPADVLMLLGAGAVAWGTTFVLTPAVRRLAIAQDWVDRPDFGRKVHQTPTPRVGGLALFGGAIAGFLFLLFGAEFFVGGVPRELAAVACGAVVIALTGLYDDAFELGFKRKFFVQVVVAYALLWGGVRVDLGSLSLFSGLTSSELALLEIPVTMLWIVGITNAVNLLDGLDGLAAGVTGIAVLSLSTAFALQGDPVALALTVPLLGAIAAFLIFNAHPASIFMGDTGSLTLGYLLASVSLLGSGHADPGLALLVPLFAVGLPILDTSATFARRVMEGHSPFLPDRDHIHHRIRNRVGSHWGAVLVMYGLAAAFGAAAVIVALGGAAVAAVVTIALTAFVGLVLYLLDYAHPETVRVAIAGRRAIKEVREEEKKAQQQEIERRREVLLGAEA